MHEPVSVIHECNDRTAPHLSISPDAAASKVRDLIIDEQNPNLKLRVLSPAAAAQGFQYGFTFDEDVNEGRHHHGKERGQLLIDAMSYQYLVGAEIDYTDGLEGAQFVIKPECHPQPGGCGNSSPIRVRREIRHPSQKGTIGAFCAYRFIGSRLQ